MLLRVIRSCCAKVETGQTFRYAQTDATTPNIVGLFLGFFPSSTGKQAKGRVGWGGGGSPVIIPNLLRKKGEGDKSAKGKRKGAPAIRAGVFAFCPPIS